MKRKTPRLKKGPEMADFLAERIYSGENRYNKTYRWFDLRSDARAYAKEQCSSGPGVRVRIFKISYKLVQDLK